MPPVPPGGLILITGANGYIAGVTVQKFIDAGFRVRGTVRSVAKNEWMNSHYGPNFSLVEVPDISAEGAFDEAIKGVDGIAHIASSTTFLPDPQQMIPPAIKNAVGMLEAAAKEPSVKSVIYTGSQAAVVNMVPNQPYHITSESWNEESKVAWTLPVTGDFKRAILNYMCAKLEAEQRSWAWVKEHKPHFTFNTVIPNINLGTMTRPDKTGFGSSSALLQYLWNGNANVVNMIPPEWFVDVEDCALLHLAALIQPDVQNERIFAFGYRYCYNEILDIFKKLQPNRKFLDHVEEIPDCGTVANERSIELLKRVGKKDGFSTLEEAVAKWIPWMLKAEEEGWGKGDDKPETSGDRLMKEFGEKSESEKSLYGKQ